MSRWRMSTSPGIPVLARLVGRNAGSIIDSSATGAVSGTEDTGGLVGAIVHPGGVIVDSTAGVQVTGRAAGLYIGGLVGYNKGLNHRQPRHRGRDWRQLGWGTCWVER